METFLQSWLIVLDQLVNEGRPFNWFEMLALQVKEQVIKYSHPHKGQQVKLFMSSYIINEICAGQQFPGLGLEWTPL